MKGHEYRSFWKFLAEEGKKGIFDHLEYHRLISYYVHLFGRKQVLVLPVEYLLISRNEFLHTLTDFMEVPIEIIPKHQSENVSTKLCVVLSIWRPINYVFHHFILAMLFLYGKDRSQFEPEVCKGYYPFIRLRYAYYAFKRRSTMILNKILPETKLINIKNYPGYRRLVDRFANSNARLEEIIEFDLTEMNYPVKHSKSV